MYTKILVVKGYSPKIIEAINKNPDIINVIRKLLSLPKEIGMRHPKGLVISDQLAKDKKQIKKFVDLLNSIKFWEFLQKAGDIDSLIALSLVTQKSRRLPYQQARNVEKTIEDLVHKTVNKLNIIRDEEISLLSPREFAKLYSSEFDHLRTTSIDFVITANDLPFAAINSAFYRNIGGVQRRYLSYEFPAIQQTLSSIPAQYILIADGAAFSKLSEDYLFNLFNNVFYVMNIYQAENKGLLDALCLALDLNGEAATPLDKIIQSALDSGQKIIAQDLPVEFDQGRLALAHYSSSHPDLALHLSSSSEELNWERDELIQKSIKLSKQFKINEVAELFGQAIGATNIESVYINENTKEQYYFSYVNPNSIIPEKFLFVCTNINIVSDTLYREVAKTTLTLLPQTKFSILIVPKIPDGFFEGEKTSIQKVLSTNVVVIDSLRLLEILKHKGNPLAQIAETIRKQADLTKISPFIINSATSKQMYFGRVQEEASIINILSTRSVALLGSRRIGKTSLIHRIRDSLVDAEFNVFFGDCQAVKNWEGFADLAERRWGPSLSREFKPSLVFDLIEKLSTNSNKKPIILLDEIDQLLSWDIENSLQHVPEAFFKAFRTISQESLAEFVFSGERVIANKLWDPQSPHWNFCQAFPLKQLDKEASNKLISQPLKDLQIDIMEENDFLDYTWEVTSGHPQIVQYLGDLLIRRLNQREPEGRGVLSLSDIKNVVESIEFKEHYVTTYWGQATNFEKALSLMIINGLNSPSAIWKHLENINISYQEDEIFEALRILDLYGIIEQLAQGYSLRTGWFRKAISAFGDIDQLISSLLGIE